VRIAGSAAISGEDWNDIEQLRLRLWLQQHEACAPEFIARTEQ
jgi:hypothetical protein